MPCFAARRIEVVRRAIASEPGAEQGLLEKDECHARGRVVGVVGDDTLTTTAEQVPGEPQQRGTLAPSVRTGARAWRKDRGMDRAHYVCWGLLAALGCVLAGCGGSGQMACRPDPITGSQQCQLASQSPADAVLTTGVAAGVYSVTGCTVNGCPLPDRCNPKTKRCEAIYCNEAQSCPAGYRCALDVHLCR